MAEHTHPHFPFFPPLTCTCSVLETCMENNNKLWRCVSSEGTEDGMVEAVKVVVVAGKERDDDMRLVQKVLLLLVTIISSCSVSSSLSSSSNWPQWQARRRRKKIYCQFENRLFLIYLCVKPVWPHPLLLIYPTPSFPCSPSPSHFSFSPITLPPNSPHISLFFSLYILVSQVTLSFSISQASFL